MRLPEIVSRAMMARSVRFLLPAVALVGLVENAKGALTLTAAGTADGFGLITFASGFPTVTISSGQAGPLGIGFETNGSVIVGDFQGNARVFPTDANNQTVANATIGQSYGQENAKDFVQTPTGLYMTQTISGTVVTVNPDGTLGSTIVTGLNSPEGIAYDSKTGHLFVSEHNNGAIANVDPVAKTFTTLATGVTGADGISMSPDNGTVYVAAANSVLGYDTTTGAQVFSPGTVNSSDGTAVGTGALAGNIFANTNDGRLVEINLTTAAQTVIASGGSRGDFVKVDPSNGTLLLTQSDSILRLTGGVFSVAHPIISLTSSAPSLYGNMLTNGSGTDKGTFTGGQNSLVVKGGSGSYTGAAVTGIDSGTGAATDYVSVTGFTPASDKEIYALDILVNGTQANPSQISTIVADINSTSTTYGYGSAIASAIDPSGGGFAQISPSSPYNLYLSFTGLSSGSNDLGFDLTQDPNFGGSATVAAVAVVPEPGTIGLVAASAGGLLLRRRARAKMTEV